MHFGGPGALNSNLPWPHTLPDIRDHFTDIGEKNESFITLTEIELLWAVERNPEEEGSYYGSQLPPTQNPGTTPRPSK